MEPEQKTRKPFKPTGRSLKGIPKQSAKLRYKIVASHMIKNGMNAKQAFLKAGYTPKTVDRAQLDMISRPQFKEAFNEVLKEQDLLDNHLRLYTHKKWRHTRTETYFDEKGTKITKKVFEETDEPDMDLVVKGLEMAHKIRGDYDQDKEGIKGKNSNKIYNIFYDPNVKEQVNSFENLIKAKIYEESNAKLKKDEDEDVDSDETDEYFGPGPSEGESGENVSGGDGKDDGEGE